MSETDQASAEDPSDVHEALAVLRLLRGVEPGAGGLFEQAFS